LITDRRIYYGTTDNRVYCVKRRSGYRVWVTDVHARVVRPLELLHVPAPPNPFYFGSHTTLEIEVILVTPFSGAEIIALDGFAGDRLATFELPENESLIGGPVAVDGQVVVAVQRYNPSDAALLILELQSVSPDEPTADEVALGEGGGEDAAPGETGEGGAARDD
jgi:outer membrane protein assembly factor BamB